MNGVRGEFRTSSPRKLTAKECDLVAVAPATRSIPSVGPAKHAARKRQAVSQVITGKQAAGLKPFATKPIAVVKPAKRQKHAMNR